jgi:hypothetical protein
LRMDETGESVARADKARAPAAGNFLDGPRKRGTRTAFPWPSQTWLATSLSRNAPG